jgi:hypothetical protein
MDIVIAVFLILAALIPIILSIYAVIDFVRKVEPLEVNIKLAISFTLYLLVSGAILLFGIVSIFVLSNDAAHNNDPEVFKSNHLVISSSITLAYLGFGLFLSWFARRDLVKTLREITGNDKKLQSIFNTER